MVRRLFDAWNRIATAAVWLAPGVLAIASFVPIGTIGHESPIDFSWQAVLHDAFLRHRHFGVDVVFTMGPWGFLLGGYHPETRSIALAAWAFIALAVSFGAVVVTRAISSRAARLCCALAVFAVLSVAGTDARLFVVPALALALQFTGDDNRLRRVALALAGVALGLVALVKFSVTVLAVVVVLIVLIDAMARKTIPVLPIAFTAAVALFDLLAGQRLADLTEWIARSMIVASSYHEMSAPPTGVEHPLWMFVASALCFLAALGPVLAHRLGRLTLLPAAGAVALVALLAKASYVRHDAFHHVTAPMSLLVVALLFTPAAVSAPRRARMVWAVALSVSFWSAWMASIADVRAHLPAAVVAKSWSDLRKVGSFAAEEQALAASHEARLAATRSSFPITVPGTLDVYTTQEEIAAAHGRILATRPVFQSYAANDWRLAELNRAWLAGAAAPDAVLLRFETIDGRLPLLEDSLSWPELMARYDVIESGKVMAVLSRRTRPKRYATSTLREEYLELGKPFSLPDAPILWAEVDVRPTFRGRVAGTLRAAPPLWLRLTLTDGSERSFRFMRSVGLRGFILSPLVEEHPGYVALATGRGGELPKVTRAVLTTGSAESDANYYVSRVRARFASLVVGD